MNKGKNKKILSKLQRVYEPISLQHLAEITICKRLWTDAGVRKTMKLVLKDLPREQPIDALVINCFLEYRDKENKILNHVNYNIDQLILPTQIKKNLKPLAKAVGVLIWEWLEKMNAMGSSLLGNILDYTDHIVWNIDGAIDPTETIRAMYYARVFPDTSETWVKLSCYCLHDCLEDFFRRVKSVNYNSFQGRPTRRWSTAQELEYIFPFYWSYLAREKPQKFLSDFNLLINVTSYCNPADPVRINMFRVAIATCNLPATKYFWESLTDDQRFKLSRKLSKGEQYHEVLKYCTTINGLDVGIYLLKQFSNYGNDKFFLEMIGLMSAMRRLASWPWLNLFMQTVDISWIKVNNIEFTGMLNSLSSTMSWRGESNNNSRKYQEICREIWSRIDPTNELSIHLEGCIHQLARDIKCLDMIINDSIMVWRRRHLLWYFIVQFRSNKIQRYVIDAFCEIILKNDSERERFKYLCHYDRFFNNENRSQ